MLESLSHWGVFSPGAPRPSCLRVTDLSSLYGQIRKPNRTKDITTKNMKNKAKELELKNPESNIHGHVGAYNMSKIID